MEFNKLTIKEIHQAVLENKATFSQITDYFLQRIEKYNPSLNAFITISAEKAREGAKKADDIFAKEREAAFEEYPLLGIPYAAKDMFLTKGVRTTAGSKVLENYIADYSATVIEKLEEAGAVLLGKTNCDAWAHGASGENSDFGATKNPWDLQRVPGGSSSGSAAAVAAGLCVFAMGTDTGGSIRNPASFCGVTGLKPTYGRVSRYGVVAMASSFDTMGSLARSAEDCELVLKVTEGKDENDATNTDSIITGRNLVETEHLSADKADAPSPGAEKKLTLGIPKEYFAEGISVQVRQTVKEALALLEKQGHKIVDVSLPMTQYGIATYYILVPSEISSNLSRYDGIRYGNPRADFGDEAKRRIMLGTYALSAGYYDAYYEKAQKVRTLIIEDFNKVFEKVDLIIGPATPTTAFKIGEKANDPLSLYMEDVLTAPASIAGLCALSVPAGFSKEGLPIGMQIIGPQWGEHKLLDLAKEYQELTDFHRKMPELLATNN